MADSEVKKIPVGTRVIGPDGLGTVKEHDVGTHDIYVECDNGTTALYCQQPGCKEYQPVYIVDQNLDDIKLDAVKMDFDPKLLGEWCHRVDVKCPKCHHKFHVMTPDNPKGELPDATG